MKSKIAALVCGLSIAGAGALSAGVHSGVLAGTVPANAAQATVVTQNGCTTDQGDGSDATTENDESTHATPDANDETGDQGEKESGGSDSETDATATAGQLSDGQDLLPKAGITLDQAVAAATGAAQGTLGDVELKDDNGTLVFDVQVGDQDVTIDAANGSVISVQAGGTDTQDQECDNEAQVAPGTLDDGADLLPQAAITVEQAVTTAQGAATGALGEVDLESNDSGVLVFSVQIGNQEVSVDAQTGKVLEVVDAER